MSFFSAKTSELLNRPLLNYTLPLGDGLNLSDHLKGILITGVAVLILSPDVLLVRLAHLDLWRLLFWRSFFVALGFLVLTVAIERRSTSRAFPAIGRLGVLLIACSTATAFLFVAALSLTSAANTLIMLATAPMFAALYSRVFLGEPIRGRTVAAILGCIVGILLLVGGSLESPSLIGDLAALLNAMLWGAALTILRASPRTNWLPAFSISHLLVLPAAALLAPTLAIPGSSIPFLLAMGFIVYPFSFVCLQLAARYLPSPEIAMILLLETVLGPLLVWFFVGEVPGRYAVLGGAVIITVLTLHSLPEKEKNGGVPNPNQG